MNTNAPYGYSTQGQQLANYDNLLQGILGMPSQPFSPQDTQSLQDATTNATSQVLQRQQNEPQLAQQTQQQAIQQAGVPQLISQFSNLPQMFALYLHDQGLSQKYAQATGSNQSGNFSPYANPQLEQASAQGAANLSSSNQADMAKVAGMTTPNQPNATTALPPSTNAQATANNPYFGSSQDIINSVNNLPTAPSLLNADTATVSNATTNLGNLLSGLINSQSNLASNAAGQSIQAYEGQTNVLNTIAGLLGNALSSQIGLEASNNTASPHLDSFGFPLGSSQDAGGQLQVAINDVQKLKGGNASEYDLFQYINQNQGMWKAQGVNMDQVWALYHQMFGSQKNAMLSGGTAKQTTKKPKVDAKGNLLGYTLPDGTFQPIQGGGPNLGGVLGGVTDWLTSGNNSGSASMNRPSLGSFVK